MRISKNSLRNNLVYQFFVTFILLTLMNSSGNCFAFLVEQKDSIDNLSFSHDGKSVVFDRCKNDGCQIQVYNLETGELAAYQSPQNERWTMGKYSYDGKKITFSVIPKKPEGGLDLGGMQIAVMDADGKNYKKVTTGPGAKLYPTFSHNGKKILYARAAYIRKKGKTPAAQYDAWEVDLTTGKETQLTFFKYFYMGYLTYFPDDERFIYYGELPEAFPGLDLPAGDPRKAQEMIRQEQMKRKIGIAGILVMKRGEDLPQRHYHFGNGFNAEKPLLSADGTKLIVEKSVSGGKFYLYSEDGNHKLVCQAGSVSSVAISPDGKYIGICNGEVITVKSVSDGTTYRAIVLRHSDYARRSENLDELVRKMPQLRILQEAPSRIVTIKN